MSSRCSRQGSTSRLHLVRPVALFALSLLAVTFASQAQAPSLLMTTQDFHDRAEIANREPWAKASLAQLLREADAFPESYEKRYGLQSVEFPAEGGMWLHWYVCPDTGTPLTFQPPNHNVCPDTGKEYPGAPFDQVVNQLRNDDLRRAALTLAQAYRFTGEQKYAKQAVGVLVGFADHYKSWPLHDNNGKPTANGGKAYSQTLDESIWLIDMAWTYDLVRGSGLLDEAAKTHIENDLLRASYVTVSKAHKGPTNNIQSWINAAIAAVGFTLHDDALIREAIDGPIGFRSQMKEYVIQGFWIEGAFGYHFYALRALVATAQMAKRAGIDLWAQEPALLSLFNGPLGIVLPDGKLPAFNDSNEVDLYAQDYLYEEAYAASKDTRYLPVMTKYGRTNRQALLFGMESVPKAQPLSLKSEVFAEAGYAALRNSKTDLTVIAKFGQHGGGHGHYDKLNFVLYSQGRTMGIDPGTQLYGLPLHHQWDSMTVAHNTVGVDEQRQTAATGKLLAWSADPESTTVTLDAGLAYSGVSFQRSILLTPQYCLIVDHITSATSHTVDWVYHNAGSLRMMQPSLGEPRGTLPTGNGYALLKDVMEASTQGEVKARFTDDSAAMSSDEANSNSPAATVRSSKNADITGNAGPLSSGSLELLMPADGEEEVMSGVAPGHDLKKPVPFVLVRKHGADVRFVALLSPMKDAAIQKGFRGEQSQLKISGAGLADVIHVDADLFLKRDSVR